MSVVIKSALAAMVLLASSVSVVNAAGAGTGSVTFSGEILESACSITPGSVDQPVALGSVSRAQLSSGGVGTKQYFDIELTGCSVTSLAAKTVTATFTGAGTTEVPGALALNGVSGAGILLTEFDGTAITLGAATTPRVITAGSNTLTFGAQLKGQSSTTGTVGTGTFDAVTHFALAYQ